LTLVNAYGSVTLRLTGPVQKGFAPLPDHFTFTVDRGTGAYEHFRTSGTIDLNLRAAGVPAHGTFTLTIHEIPTPVTTGISGIVLEGPISPVFRPGVANTRPVPGAIISVRLTSNGPEIDRQTADSQGRFRLALEPGVYMVVALAPKPGQALPHGIPQIVVVTKGHVSNVTLPMDTGIV